MPTYAELLWPTLRAVIALGGSGSIEEINAKVREIEGFTEQQEAVLHGDGPRTAIEYRLGWARSYLKAIGALDNSARGVWAVSDSGRDMGEADVAAAHDQFRAEMAEQRRAKGRRRRSRGRSASADGDEAETDDWKDALLETVLAMSPNAFERLAQRLLREAGFINVNVTGRAGDGGIDGLGVYRLSLVGFPVFFQCKRYRSSVGAGAVRDFRGAMAGRGDKGLLITTGSFTADAKAEALRDGAPPIDLIDGDRLCDLLKEYAVGVRVETRVIEDVTIDRGYFESMGDA